MTVWSTCGGRIGPEFATVGDWGNEVDAVCVWERGARGVVGTGYLHCKTFEWW